LKTLNTVHLFVDMYKWEISVADRLLHHKLNLVKWVKISIWPTLWRGCSPLS